jgi:hypothetical protein
MDAIFAIEHEINGATAEQRLAFRTGAESKNRRTVIGVNAKPNPKRCNASFRDTVAADAPLVAWL